MGCGARQGATANTEAATSEVMVDCCPSRQAPSRACGADGFDVPRKSDKDFVKRYNILMLRSEASIQGDRLANALRFLGINFLAVDHVVTESIHSHPSQLIKALAQSKEARLSINMLHKYGFEKRFWLIDRPLASG